MRFLNNRLLLAALLVSPVVLPGFAKGQDATTEQVATTDKPTSNNPSAETQSDEKGWKKLIESPEMEGWESINFGGEGAVSFKDGVLKMESGIPMTGIRYTKKDFPTENYEIRWKARRVRGSDFFVGITFPIGEEHCSLIVGGWGGGLVGISSINGNNASENQTARYGNFKNKQWYTFKVRVDAKNLTAWVEGQDEPIVVEREGNKFSVRAETRPTRPLGYSGFESLVEVKDWEYKLLDEPK